MTGADLRALCVAVVEARDAWDAVVAAAPDRALALDSPEWRAMLSAEGALHVALFRSTTNDAARAILAALDDAERVATERAQRRMIAALYWRAGRIAVRAEDADESGHGSRADMLIAAAAGVMEAGQRMERVLRESAKGGVE